MHTYIYMRVYIYFVLVYLRTCLCTHMHAYMQTHIYTMIRIFTYLGLKKKLHAMFEYLNLKQAPRHIWIFELETSSTPHLNIWTWNKLHAIFEYLNLKQAPRHIWICLCTSYVCVYIRTYNTPTVHTFKHAYTLIQIFAFLVEKSSGPYLEMLESWIYEVREWACVYVCMYVCMWCIKLGRGKSLDVIHKCWHFAERHVLVTWRCERRV